MNSPPVRRLASKKLLPHAGSTTLLLEEAVGGPLGIRLLERNTYAASRLQARVARLLELAESAPVIVRRSELLAPDGTPVSRNLVVSDASAPAHVVEALSDPDTPLGPALAVTGEGPERRIVSFGSAPWEDGDGDSGKAPWRDYLIRLVGAPDIYVAERFNPDLVGAP